MNPFKSLQAIRGMPDILPEQMSLWQFLEQKWRDISAGYGYAEIRLPLLEYTQLFQRAIGEVTDIVEKEMFTFQDREGLFVSLRPEGTASCIRACLEHGLLHNQTQKLWYCGPMFRYERPQKGRFRQFYQIGVESFGFSDPFIELEHILIVSNFFKQLKIEKTIVLEINSLGQPCAREAYITKLVAYFEKYEARFTAEEKKRLAKNPLRLLDSKNPDLQILIDQAPKLVDYLDKTSRDNLDKFCLGLDAHGIGYRLNSNLVRGLDYYNGIVYEWTSPDLGAQSAVCAGGRYDNLVLQLGGKQMAATGFALGIERLVLLLSVCDTKVDSGVDLMVIYQGDEKIHQRALEIAEQVRLFFPRLKIYWHPESSSFKSQFKKADKLGAKWALILGEAEYQADKLSLKFLREQKAQIDFSVSELEKQLKKECL